ncbi:MAG TPA: hypothetical protein VFG76_12250, partial [Candidatus Polarisedimenticolia bacterium]|nr:hypothetical protein [Candidatus Polarisedimenticolia bacterium]
MTRGSHLICWFVALLVALAPLPFGAVGPISRAAVQTAILVATLAWVMMRWRSGRAPLPWRDPLFIGGASLMAYGLLQLTPLPAALVRLLSPATH